MLQLMNIYKNKFKEGEGTFFFMKKIFVQIIFLGFQYKELNKDVVKYSITNRYSK